MVNYSSMSLVINLSVQQLRQAADLKEEITALERELSQLLGSTAQTAVAKAPKKKFTMSAAAKAKISAAAKLRWAKVKATKPATKPKASPAPKKKGGMSPAGRAKISAAAKARWAKAKAAGKKSL
jgi:RNA:NAD 2'-phosphotransferase (TPT1/KptA family)